MPDNHSDVNPASPEFESMNGSFSTNGNDPGAIAGAGDGGGGDVSFLDDLAKAMRMTAAAEQSRDAELTDQRRQAHLDAIRAREALEAEDLRELAKEDVKGIDAWSDGEIKRIKLERERRIASRREQLQVRLEEHRMVIASEVEAVEAAISTYRSETERFFDRLGSQTDPVEIARQAGTRPPFPDLEQIGPQEAPAVAAYQAPVYVPPAYEPPPYTMTVTSIPAAPVESIDVAPEPSEAVAESETADTAETADAPAAVEGVEAAAIADTVEPESIEGPADSAETPEPEPVVAEAQDAEAPVEVSPGVGVMDPEVAQAPAETPPWGAPVEAIGQADTAAQPNDEAVVGVEDSTADQDGADEPVSVGAEARVVMPRTTGSAGSWLRWPNSSVDRSDPSR